MAGEFYKPHYDVICIGASHATMAAAFELRKLGRSVLILEQHNLPGGCAQSYVRGGTEFEASLHEMMGIGPAAAPQAVRRYFEENDVFVDWVPIPECYHYVSPRVECHLRAGNNGDYSAPIEDIVNAVKGDETLRTSLKEFFALCDHIYFSGAELLYRPTSKIKMFLNHEDYVTTIGYTTQEMFDHFHFPPLVQEILSAYWTYMGSPINELPFTMFATILSGYIGYGPYIPRQTSFEISLKMAEAATKKGIQIEYGQKVKKILVDHRRVKGVALVNGNQISCDAVVSGCYPNTVYSSMIAPSSAVPRNAHKMVNSLPMGITCFSVSVLLDKPAEELGIYDYCTFVSNVSSKEAFELEKSDVAWPNLTITCPNILMKDATPEGTCLYNMVVLPSVTCFSPHNEEEYNEFKLRHAREFLEAESKRLGVNLFDHILELAIETPVTISSYCGSPFGGIYGYRHTMDNHPVARTLTRKKSYYIHGLVFAGAHQVCGDGMAPACDNGKVAVMDLLAQEKKRH